jgi:hypothetical protein
MANQWTNLQFRPNLASSQNWTKVRLARPGRDSTLPNTHTTPHTRPHIQYVYGVSGLIRLHTYPFRITCRQAQAMTPYDRPCLTK